MRVCLLVSYNDEVLARPALGLFRVGSIACVRGSCDMVVICTKDYLQLGYSSSNTNILN